MRKRSRSSSSGTGPSETLTATSNSPGYTQILDILRTNIQVLQRRLQHHRRAKFGFGCELFGSASYIKFLQ